MKKFLLILFSFLFSFNLIFAASPWDFLRPISEAAVVFEGAIKIIVLFISLLIFGISIKAYLKKKSKRLLLISAAFFLFFIKLLIGYVDVCFSPGIFFTPAAISVFDLLILVFFVIALFKKSN